MKAEDVKTIIKMVLKSVYIGDVFPLKIKSRGMKYSICVKRHVDMTYSEKVDNEYIPLNKVDDKKYVESALVDVNANINRYKEKILELKSMIDTQIKDGKTPKIDIDLGRSLLLSYKIDLYNERLRRWQLLEVLKNNEL